MPLPEIIDYNIIKLIGFKASSTLKVSLAFPTKHNKEYSLSCQWQSNVVMLMAM
jgi:hypothetical protein